MLDDAAPVVNSLKKLTLATGSHGLHWVRLGVLFGAMMGMISSLLVFQLGQARVWFAMSLDAEAVRAGTSALSHTRHGDLDRGLGRRYSGGCSGYRNPRGFVEHRHTV